MSKGQRIKNYRKEMNLTQKEVADSVNISRSYYSDIENDRTNPSLDVLERIADTLSVSVSGILQDTKHDYKEDTELLLEEFHKNPNLKTLFYKGKDMKPETLKWVLDMMDKLKDE